MECEQYSMKQNRNKASSLSMSRFMQMHRQRQQIIQDRDAAVEHKIIALDQMLQLYVPEQLRVPLDAKVIKNLNVKNKIPVKTAENYQNIDSEVKKQIFMVEGVMKYTHSNTSKGQKQNSKVNNYIARVVESNPAKKQVLSKKCRCTIINNKSKLVQLNYDGGEYRRGRLTQKRQMVLNLQRRANDNYNMHFSSEMVRSTSRIVPMCVYPTKEQDQSKIFYSKHPSLVQSPRPDCQVPTALLYRCGRRLQLKTQGAKRFYRKQPY